VAASGAMTTTSGHRTRIPMDRDRVVPGPSRPPSPVGAIANKTIRRFSVQTGAKLATANSSTPSNHECEPAKQRMSER
jgi:hypothetical protein